MTKFNTAIAIPAYDADSYDAAYKKADMRANHSFFDQHILIEDDGSYIAIDEGDYGALPQHMIDRIAHSIPGRMGDDLDDASQWGFIDPDHDAIVALNDCPF